MKIANPGHLYAPMLTVMGFILCTLAPQRSLAQVPAAPAAPAVVSTAPAALPPPPASTSPLAPAAVTVADPAAAAATLRSEIAALEVEQQQIRTALPLTFTILGGVTAYAGLMVLATSWLYCPSGEDDLLWDETCIDRSLIAGNVMLFAGLGAFIPSLIITLQRSRQKKVIDRDIRTKTNALHNLGYAVVPSRHGMQLQLAWHLPN